MGQMWDDGMGEIVTVTGVSSRGLPGLPILVELDGPKAKILGYGYDVNRGLPGLVARSDVEKVARRYPRHTITDYNGQIAKY